MLTSVLQATVRTHAAPRAVADGLPHSPLRTEFLDEEQDAHGSE